MSVMMESADKSNQDSPVSFTRSCQVMPVVELFECGVCLYERREVATFSFESMSDGNLNMS